MILEMKAELKRQGSHAALPQAEPEDHERLCFSIERSQMKEVLDRSDSEEEIELFGDQDGQNLKIERELVKIEMTADYSSIDKYVI
mmetsp:Transcript_25653/g.44235  ORF Transcript_25653/g.44235 Transcript_25653/m.44235 type:complete len:86 (+) Transcript_25653:3-260(+)